MSGFFAERRRGVSGSLAAFASRAIEAEAESTSKTASPAPKRPSDAHAPPDAGGIIDALRGAVKEREEAQFNPRTEAAAALAECQSSLDEHIREALSAMVEPLTTASGAKDEAARNSIQRAALECSQRIMRGVTACTEDLQEADTESTKIQLRLQGKRHEERLNQTRRANTVQLANKQQQLEHQYKQEFQKNVQELAGGGGNSAHRHPPRACPSPLTLGALTLRP
jgi:hypothetical protein